MKDRIKRWGVPLLLSLSANAYALDATHLDVSVSGTSASLSWSAVAGADGYTLRFAPRPYFGGPIGSVELGSALTLSTNLPVGTSYYVAITAHSLSGEVGEFSNIGELVITSASVEAIPYTREALAGNTYYNVFEECDQGVCEWLTVTMAFGDRQVTMEEAVSGSVVTVEYGLSPEGYIALHEEGGVNYIALLGSDGMICWDNDGGDLPAHCGAGTNEYLFATQQEAEAFLAARQ